MLHLDIDVQMPGEEKVDSPQDVQSVVVSTHAIKYLCHVAEVSLYGVLLDACSVFCQCSHVEPICKHM